ncbi:tyrosine-type recombinase/integrase [uncultured Paludibaculum sp.]|uniref:tyrosine-type recombinase/integrase n=1 Tax=uncultured Paludibaculum sp. TaxID=1765020 RepID=UPI002AAB4ED7|nr:tyrosine-type recombinase/integrase [uncultured Paludibaculum sp.]
MPKKKSEDSAPGNRVKLRGLGQMYRREAGGNWHVSFSVNGQQFRETTHTDKYNDAVAFLKKRIGQIEKGEFTSTKTDRVMVADILRDVIEDYRVKGRDWLRTAGPIIEKYLIPAFRSMRVANLNVSHLRKYVSDQLAAGMSNASVNRHISILRRAYNLGTVSGKVNAANVPHFKEVALEENNVREGFWTHEEYVRFRDALPEDERAVFIFGYWTGCRFSEVTMLRWEQVDLEGRMVKLRKGTTKNKRPRLIPLGNAGLGDLHDMLVAQKTRHDALCPESPWVFFRRGSITPGRASARRGNRVMDIRKAYLAARTATGIQHLFHDLRRTGVRNLVRAGVPESVAMRISGHLTRSVFERYNIVDEADLHDAADKLAKYVTGKAAPKESDKGEE